MLDRKLLVHVLAQLRVHVRAAARTRAYSALDRAGAGQELRLPCRWSRLERTKEQMSA